MSKRMPFMDGLDPGKEFFMAVATHNADGSLTCGEAEGVEGVFETEADALARCRELSHQFGFVAFTYRCTPLKRVVRTGVRVETIGGKKK